ncbi:PAS domain-containing sensor histidine kinase [Bacteroides sp.]|uniref:sensor histidine kinase n=1 Tax=Bacteroides sp. TaxID=29523 RepID=UPI0025C0E541|nr:PAS domain-containing sensor histidine kinase [Bacteroides sp.]
MGLYEQKTKEELLIIVDNMEKKVERLSSELSSLKTGRFREKYSTRILDALPDMLTVFDHDANIVELASSPETNHVEGTDSHSIVGSNVKEIVPEEAYDSVRKNMDKVIATGQGSIAKHSLILDGVLHHYENRIFPLDEKYLLCMCRDVSEKVKAEALNASQRNEIIRLNSLMHAILNNVPVYLFVKDTGDNFRYLYWNRAFAEQTGIAVETAVGKTDIEIFPNSEDARRFRTGDFAVMQSGRMEYLEEYTTLSGEVRMVTMIKTLVPSGNEHPYIIGVGWDVTDIKKVEKELTTARIKAEEADKLKSSFLANMSHEIRTPLNAIVGFSKLIIESANKEEQHQYAELVEKNSGLLLNLFNDILDLSALEADSLRFSMRSVRLRDVCVQLYYLNHNSVQPGVKLILDEVDSELSIQGDWDRISQIWLNLLSNAIKFTSNGEIHFGFEKKGQIVQGYVSDTGIGIPAERVTTIFSRFGKVNDFVQGTGLGLTICRMLTERMGGRIWVRSKVGIGTTFYFTLPVEFEEM